MKIKFSIVFCFIAIMVHAQYKQQLRGVVVDHLLQRPLAGATVTVARQSVITNEEGLFRFNDLPVGSYTIAVSYAGFKEATLENITVNSGKETVLTIPLEQLVRTEKEVLIKSNSKKNKPLNDMSAVSARAFTVEETQKYAAAVNDPLRMATIFPGVLAPDDGNNRIIIRGNSPAGLLWKMEGMDIPNPNHFSSVATSGGGISILSSQLLSNSDFVTSAFAAEYGNALSGVFDLKLRKGNNEKNEYTLQAGMLGLNIAAEGPFSKSYKGSYLVNYRYSTLELLNKMNILTDNGATNFQDMSYNIWLPTRKMGEFTLFGFGGLSSERRKTELDSSKWENNDQRYPYETMANTAMTGITHTMAIGKNASLKSGVGWSYTKNAYNEQYIEDDLSITENYRDHYSTRKILFNTTLNYRFDNKNSLRAGIIANNIRFNYFQQDREHRGDPIKTTINATGNTSTEQLFAQWQYRPGNNFSFNTGVHYLHLALNNTSSVEPRLSAKWNITANSSISAGYGWHSQLQPLSIYFAQIKNADGSFSYPNKNLGFTKARHYVLSYGQKLATSLFVKTEIYYQQLFNVAVSAKPGSTFSSLNVEEDYAPDPLVNEGKGKNYGIEVSLERYLRNNFYFTLSNSVYQSKYTALDGIERNTRFNGNYIITLISGRDFISPTNRRSFGVNVKVIYAGGLRTTPIDLAASQLQGYTVFREAAAYSLQNPAYFRTDLRVSIQWNRKSLTSTLSLDIQNLTNRMNIYSQYYSNDDKKIITQYQTGFIPVLNYKIDF